MSIYRVALVDLASGLSSNDKDLLRQGFWAWLRRANEQARQRHQRVVVNWVNSANSANGAHLIIYFVLSAVQSVLVNAPNYIGGVRMDFGGMTLLPAAGAPTLSASEVYVSEHQGDLKQISITTIHEAMHNQRQEGDSLHNLGGAAASPGTFPTPQNLTQMAESLHYHRRQWTGGFQAARQLNNALNSNNNSVPGIYAP